ncbi:hypothetical protein DHL47_00845 [Streptococcus panodentis]|uniref:DUF3667 domain-containing protein n=2 Tax=Streptococcus panodentis TaxID=1581472 RepID=A0ABS5ATJ7_9STRE|nr:hypothetical protein [Streptococcus panodentis]
MDMKKEKCRHQLFDYEADYVICPACGEPIAENMPADPNFKLQVIRRSRSYKKFLKWQKFYYLFLFLSLLIAFNYQYLDSFVIKSYGITGIDSFEPTLRMRFYPFSDVVGASAVLIVILAGPHLDRRKWLRLWHLQRQAYILQASWIYLFFRVVGYGLLIYLGKVLWSRLIYLEELERLQRYLSGQELIYASMVYAKENLRGLYIVLGLNFLADCWLFFYQRLAIRVNQF